MEKLEFNYILTNIIIGLCVCSYKFIFKLCFYNFENYKHNKNRLKRLFFTVKIQDLMKNYEKGEKTQLFSQSKYGF